MTPNLVIDSDQTVTKNCSLKSVDIFEEGRLQIAVVHDEQ